MGDFQISHARLKAGRASLAVITLTHKPTGTTATSAPIARYSRAYWARRNEMVERMAQTLRVTK